MGFSQCLIANIKSFLRLNNPFKIETEYCLANFFTCVILKPSPEVEDMEVFQEKEFYSNSGLFFNKILNYTVLVHQFVRFIYFCSLLKSKII
jgi:hypothetical protein